MLDLRSLSIRLGAREVIRQFSASASAGRTLAVIGPNGAGKSTLLRAIVGALRPSGGEVRWRGQDPAVLHGRRLASQVAYAGQRTILPPGFTTEQTVALARYALNDGSARVEAALGAMALCEDRNRAVHELSAGHQQRVAVARVIAQAEERSLLVLDEPTSSMDTRMAMLALGALRAAARVRGSLVVAALHDLVLAADWADDVWLLDTGELRAAGSPNEVLTPAHLQSVYGVPFERVTAGGRTVPIPVLPRE